MEIRKVLKRTNGIKYLIIPKKSKIKAGSNVLVTDNLTMINQILKEEKEEKENGRRKR